MGNIVKDAITGKTTATVDDVPATRRNIYIAGLLGVDPVQLQWLLANAPTPEPLTPRNWTLAGPLGSTDRFAIAGVTPWAGLAAIVYPGAIGGFTFGPPVASRADGT